MPRDRKPDLESQIQRLERKHSQLSLRVDELDRQLFLTQTEQRLVTELKKEKLAAKDALFELKRSSWARARRPSSIRVRSQGIARVR
jgi:hypothetical protein